MTNVGEDGKYLIQLNIKISRKVQGILSIRNREIRNWRSCWNLYETTATIDESGELVVSAETLNTKDLPAGKYVLFETVFKQKTVNQQNV